MRWYWIDRFLEFESARHAVAVKTVTLAEEHLHDHFPGHPVMPHSLIIEGFAQCGGLLVGECTRYSANMILAKVPKAVFHFPVRPGDSLVYRVELDYINEEGALVKATATIGERLQTEAEVFFANVMEGPRARRLFTPRELVVMMQLLRAYEVGRAADGSPLRPPPELLEGAASYRS
jgi:3-hydroxyacyl-[acyl-carrier-protein] dehydratase